MNRGVVAGLLGLMALAATIAVAAPVPTSPDARMLRVGDFTLTALRDERNVLPNDGKVFGIGQPVAALGAALAQAGAPTDHLDLSVDALLVRMPGHLVLIDTGLGPKVGGVLMASLAQAGVTPTEVTDVLVTHAHPDHVGGLVTLDGRPAFPNATIRLSAAEWAAMQRQPNAAAIVAAVRDRVVPFTPGHEVLRGITPIALTGHTPGHVGYRIESNGQHLLDIGDSAHSSILSLAHPDWAVGYDGDAVQGRQTREAVLARVAADRELVFAPHFPFPGIGRIVRQGTAYAWQPVATVPAGQPR